MPCSHRQRVQRGRRSKHSNIAAQLRLVLPMDHRRLFIGDSPQAQRLRHVLLNGGMILDSHRFRPASTRLQNSASFSGWTWPFSISRSRRSTSAISSASDHASPTGGREPNNDSASNTRCSTGNASTVFFRFSRIAGICRFYFTQARPASRSASSTWAQIRFWASIPSSRRDAMSIVLTFSNGFAPPG